MEASQQQQQHQHYVKTNSSPHTRTPALVRPIPMSTRNLMVKPIAMKVLRPIPQRASEQFYNEAFEEGLTLQETSEAAALANDWHRKWTQQDEQNHTTPNADFYASNAILPGHYYDDDEVDRQGARNPSLMASDESCSSASSFYDGGAKRALDPSYSPPPIGEPDLVLFNPEDRLSASSWSEASNSSSLSSHMAPQVKRQFVGALSAVEDQHAEPRFISPMAVRPAAVRPMAIRAVRPEMPFPVEEAHQRSIPQDILTMRQYGNVSPMSFSETPAPEMTVMNQETNEMIHVVEEDLSCAEMPQTMVSMSDDVLSSRDAVLHSLAVSQGDVDSSTFKSSLDPLLKFYSQQELEAKPHSLDQPSKSIDGMWLTLSKPSYFGCLGENDDGDPMYTLGRMAFDMFSPTNLVCSLQGNFNPVEVVSDEERAGMLELVPKSLREEVESGKTELRTYHVVSAFTIEASLAAFPDAPNKDVHRPIKGIMTTFGYSLPDPDVPDRHSIWFTGGRIEPNSDPADISGWKRLFTLHPPKHSFGEKAKLLAVKLLMGATIPEAMSGDGSMEYTFTRPLGGHGMAYVDVVYLDQTLRIVRGHRGTIFVFSRIPQKNEQGRIHQ